MIGHMPRRFLSRLPSAERAEVMAALRTETVGGVLLIAAALIALIWANSPWQHAYGHMIEMRLGPSALHMRLSVEQWAQDGLLAVFFYVAGIELKRELVVGELRDPAAAVLPVIAACCGVLLPIVCYFAIAAGQPGAAHGWAIPTATDIAFALAVLAVFGKHLPASLRAFLLTLAVVDDLIAIAIIAVFYSDKLSPWPLLVGVALIGVFYVLQRGRVRAWWLYAPVVVAAWGFVHAGGVHATVAGVAMGLLMRVTEDEGEHKSPGERMEHLFRPISAGVAVPVFALMATGVNVSAPLFGQVFTNRLSLAIVVAMVAGKTLGIFGGAYAAVRFTRAQLAEELAWSDVFGVALVGGVGFTVSLLIGSLAFKDASTLNLAKTAVLAACVLAAAIGAVLLHRRDRYYRTLEPVGTVEDAGSASRERDLSI